MNTYLYIIYIKIYLSSIYTLLAYVCINKNRLVGGLFPSSFNFRVELRGNAAAQRPAFVVSKKLFFMHNSIPNVYLH